MPGERCKEAELHADRASRILMEHDETIVAYLQQNDPAAADVRTDWAEQLENLKEAGGRAAALASAHALTALALRKVGGR